MRTVPLVGYTSKLSGRPGSKIDFKISSQSQSPIKAQLFRSISADPNPKGVGIVEESCEEFFPVQTFAGRNQPFYPGSYGKTAIPVAITLKTNSKLPYWFGQPNTAFITRPCLQLGKQNYS